MADGVFSNLTATPEEIEPAGTALTQQASAIREEAQALQRLMGRLDENWKGRGALNWIPPLVSRLQLLVQMADLLAQIGAGLRSAAQVYLSTDTAWGRQFETLFASSDFASVPDYLGGGQ